MMFSTEKIAYYDQIFNTPEFHHNKQFANEEMFKYWIFKEYAGAPLTLDLWKSQLEYWSSIGCEFRVKNHPFMIEHYDEFLEYCKIKKD